MGSWVQLCTWAGNRPSVSLNPVALIVLLGGTGVGGGRGREIENKRCNDKKAFRLR